MSNSSAEKRIGRPPGADADKTREALLDAALQAFADRGFDGASIREITGSIGVGHNLVRHYFGSKDDLWRAVVHHGLGPAAERIAAMFDARDAQPLRPTLRAAIEVLVSEASANPAAFRIFLAEALRGGPRFEQIFEDLLEPISRALLDYARSTGEIPRAIDLRVVGVFVFGAAFSPFTFEGFTSRLGFAPPEEGVALDGRSDQLVEMIVAGLTGLDE